MSFYGGIKPTIQNKHIGFDEPISRFDDSLGPGYAL
jgi:hypothetical protein